MPVVVDLVGYSHVQVDRTAVLLDVWSHEIAFLKNKKRVSCKVHFIEIYSLMFSGLFDHRVDIDVTFIIF